MLSVRALTRTASRALSRPLTSTFRPLSVSSRPTLLRSCYAPLPKQTYLAFSTSIRRPESAGESDQLLSAKFEQERRLENETRDSNSLPQSCQDYLDSSPFELEDVPGTQDVVLTRQFENETIKVEFTIADLTNMSDEMDGMEEDPAMEDEEDVAEEMSRPPAKRTINQAGRGGKVDVVAEDSVAPADRGVSEEEGDEQTQVAYPLTLNITITKPEAGAVNIRAVAQDGLVTIDNVFYFPRAELVDALTPEDRLEQSKLYEGPPFLNLDTELQSMLERYLDERGIDTALAAFLPEFVEYKEQREYVQWLENMKKFIDA